MESGESYDAFISYSHKHDAELAKRLQPQIERFAKPWYRIRALRVFRDDASLSGNADLPQSIQDSLQASRWLILLASPEAARSKWVDDEVRWWLENKTDPLDHVLIAVTGGCPPWDSASPATPGTASIVPPSLQNRLVAEPRWVDLREVRDPKATDDYRTRFQDAVADLAAPVRGKPKDFLYGEAVRQHRRAMRLARQAVTVMAVLTLAAVAGGIYSYTQRNYAIAQANLANSRQLVAESSAIEASHPGLARQLLAVADRVDPTPQVVGALINSLSMPGELDYGAQINAEAYMRRQPILAVGTDTGVSLVNTATGRRLASLTSHIGSVTAAAFSPDSRVMATGGRDSYTRLWDVIQPSRPKLIETITASLGGVDGLSFSPSGDILAIGFADRVGLVNVQDPARPVVLATFPAGPTVAISPDGHLLATPDGTAIQLWDITDPRHPTRLAALANSAAGVLAFSPNGHLLAYSDSNDFDVHIWDITDPAHPQARPVLSGHTESVDALAFSPDGNLLATGGWDQTARVWDVADPTHPDLITTLSGHASAVTSLAFSPDGQTLAGGSDDQSVFLWNVDESGGPVPLATLTGSAGPVAFSANNKLVAAGSPAELWNMSDPAAPRAVSSLVPSNVTVGGGVEELDFSPDGQILAMDDGFGRDTQLWELTRPAQPKLAATLTGSSGYTPDGLAFSSDGQSLITSGDSGPQIWNIHTPSRPTRLPNLSVTTPKGAKPSLDGSYVSAADRAASWQASSPGTMASFVNWMSQNKGASIIGLGPQAGMVATIVGSSQQLALSYADQLDLWSVSDTAHPLASLTSSIGDPVTAAISRDGRLLAAASMTGVTIWNISDPAHPAALTTLNFSSQAGEPYLAFSPDGDYLATGGYGASDQVWEVDSPGIINRLCVESGSTITMAQWNQYVPGVPYASPCSPDAYLPGAGSEEPPYTPLPPAPLIRVPVSNLHSVNWQNTPIPGQFCAVPGLVSMGKGQGSASSSKWGHVQFYLGTTVTTRGPGTTITTYGDLQGGRAQDAAVQVWCDNGGGTADGEITEAYLIFSLHNRTLRLIGTVTPQEQPPDEHISIFNSIRISPGSVVAYEDWYRASDATCCPTGRAVTVWTYTHGRLIPGTPDITS